LSEEDRIQAEKLYNATEGLFMKLGKTRGMNYTNAVKNCRIIMKNYAGQSMQKRHDSYCGRFLKMNVNDMGLPIRSWVVVLSKI